MNQTRPHGFPRGLLSFRRRRPDGSRTHDPNGRTPNAARLPDGAVPRRACHRHRLSAHRPDAVDQLLRLADRGRAGLLRRRAGVEPRRPPARPPRRPEPTPADLSRPAGHPVRARPAERLQAQPGRLELGRRLRPGPVDPERPRRPRRRPCCVLRHPQPGGRPMIRSLGCAAALLAVAACGRSDPRLDQTGPQPDLPDVRQTLVPPMKIAKPVGWGDEVPTAPAGYTVTALATDLKIPRQMLVLPNGDILVAEGRGGGAPALRPKDVIAGVIKKKGNTRVESGNRITLLRDANNDGRPEVRTVFIDNLNAPYGLAFVDGYLYVAEQDELVRFPYQEGQTRITAAPQRVTR